MNIFTWHLFVLSLQTLCMICVNNIVSEVLLVSQYILFSHATYICCCSFYNFIFCVRNCIIINPSPPPPFLFQESSWQVSCVLLYWFCVIHHWFGHHHCCDACVQCCTTCFVIFSSFLPWPPIPGGSYQGRFIFSPEVGAHLEY